MTDSVEAERIAREITRRYHISDPFSAVVRATRMPIAMSDPRLPDNPIVFVNDAFVHLTGFDRHEVIGRNCRFLQGPDTDTADVARLRAAITARERIEIDLYNYRKDGTPFWNRLMVSPVFDDAGVPTYYFASQMDVTLERERLVKLLRDRDSLAEAYDQRVEDLEQSELRLRFALKAGRLGSWSRDLGTNRLDASDECRRHFGRTPHDDFTHADLLGAIHAEDRPHIDAAVAAAIRDRSDLDVEYRITTPAGEERWLQIKGQASYRADGTPLSLVGVTQDITDRRRAEDQRALLANELSHRVKNTLATMQAIIGQTLRKADSLATAGELLTARIQSMASANDLLVEGNWESAAIHDLLDRTLAPFGGDDPTRFGLAGPVVRVPPRIAVALALGIHELATNASKYGGLSNAGGRVDIGWHLSDQVQRVLHIRWEERGGPPVAPPTRTGFGTTLINRILAQESGGTATIAYPPDGVIFEAALPLPEAELPDQRMG